MREEVVKILGYVLLGMFIYSFIFPILEQISTVIIQWLENVKGKLMVDASKLQNEINDISKEEETIPEQITNVIGFHMPENYDYEEDYDDDDDEDKVL